MTLNKDGKYTVTIMSNSSAIFTFFAVLGYTTILLASILDITMSEED